MTGQQLLHVLIIHSHSVDGPDASIREPSSIAPVQRDPQSQFHTRTALLRPSYMEYEVVSVALVEHPNCLFLVKLALFVEVK
jgi:hypothetical protein